MNHPSQSVIQTWIFLAKSTDPKLKQAKFLADKQLKKSFGSIELAQIYLEQIKDEQIEVVLI